MNIKLLNEDEYEELTTEELAWERELDLTPNLARQIVAIMAEGFDVSELEAVTRFAKVLNLLQLKEITRGPLLPIFWYDFVLQDGQDNRKYKAPLLRQKAKPKLKGQSCVKCGDPSTFVTTPNQYSPKGVFYCRNHEREGRAFDWEDTRENYALRNKIPKRKE